MQLTYNRLFVVYLVAGLWPSVGPFAPLWSLARAVAGEFRLATFEADATPPLGHPLLGGVTTPPPAHAIDDPLSARGFALIGPEKPIVCVAIDWCEIRNDAYDRWRDVLAEAAGTSRERVLVSSIHQHNAPLADLEAQRILERSTIGVANGGGIVQLKFHEECVQRTAKALREGLAKARPVTHVGVGRGLVEKVSSNRRYLAADGTPRFDRGSMSGGDREKREAPEGTIDPWLRTLSFWDGDSPVCAVHVYAVHPMSHWGSGRVTADFPGLARQRRQADDPNAFQIYASGSSGNVAPGKYNDGNPVNKRIFADRLYQGMLAAWKATERQPLRQVSFRNAPIRVPLRESGGYSQAELAKQLEHTDPKKRCLAALGLSWRKRVAVGQPIDLPLVEFSSDKSPLAALVLLPANRTSNTNFSPNHFAPTWPSSPSATAKALPVTSPPNKPGKSTTPTHRRGPGPPPAVKQPSSTDLVWLCRMQSSDRPRLRR